jgi:hypothetical protein
MDKRKRKSKPEQSSWLRGLFAPATIDFVAYLPLEECAARLKSREKTRFWHSTKTYVTLTPPDKGFIYFRIERGGTPHRSITATGYLESWEGIYTHIAGEVQSKSYGWLWVLIAVPFFFGYSILMRDISAAICVTALVAGVIVFDLHVMIGRRYTFAGMIEATLGY